MQGIFVYHQNKIILKTIKISIFLLAILFAGSLQAQDLFKSQVKNLPNYDYAPYHFGFILALNDMHFTIDPIDELHLQKFQPVDADDVLPSPDDMNVLGIDYTSHYGFTVGIVGNLRLGQYADLRFIPSLAFGERIINFEIARNYQSNNNRADDTIFKEKRIPSTYIDFPLMLKYKSKRYNNIRAYLIGGMKYSLDLASLSDRESESSNNILMKLDRNDVYAEIGFGFDYYLGFFKFGTEIKMSYSLMDPLLREGNMYSGSIEDLRSKIFQLSFTFE